MDRAHPPPQSQWALAELSGQNYGEWLNDDTLQLEGYPSRGGALPTEIYVTLYYARSVDTLSQMARVFSRQKEADQYAQLFADIRVAFQRDYVASNVRMQGDTQAGYALALHFDLLKEEDQPPATEHMLGTINRLSWTFVDGDLRDTRADARAFPPR